MMTVLLCAFPLSRHWGFLSIHDWNDLFAPPHRLCLAWFLLLAPYVLPSSDRVIDPRCCPYLMLTAPIFSVILCHLFPSSPPPHRHDIILALHTHLVLASSHRLFVYFHSHLSSLGYFPPVSFFPLSIV